VSNSSLFTPALLRTHSFVFIAVHETRRKKSFSVLSSERRQDVFFHASKKSDEDASYNLACPAQQQPGTAAVCSAAVSYF